MYAILKSLSGVQLDIPSMSIGSGALDYEKIFGFAKRKLDGNMLLRSYKGAVMRVSGKWNLLTRSQYNTLCKFIHDNTEFYIVMYNPRTASDNPEQIRMYSGNMHAEPLFVDSEGLPRYYKNCTVNFISVGLV